MKHLPLRSQLAEFGLNTIVKDEKRTSKKTPGTAFLNR